MELSTANSTDINLLITADATGPKHFNMKLAKSKLEQLCGDLVERSGAVQGVCEGRRPQVERN